MFMPLDQEEKNQPSTAEIQDWLASYVGELLDIKPDQVDVTIPFERYGLDSSVVAGLTGDLEDWLGYELDPTLIYDYPTISMLSKYLSGQ